MPIKNCRCGSGRPRHEARDGHGIFLFFYCQACYDEKRSKYRADIFEPYKTDERIEPED